jgi:hypothetical protein
MRTKLLAIAFAVTSLFIFQSQAQTADSGLQKVNSQLPRITREISGSASSTRETPHSIPALPSQPMIPGQSWIGTLIQAVSSVDHGREWLLSGTRKAGAHRS